MNELLNISPIDGRYKNKVKDLENYFSEYALIKYRVFVELSWLKFIIKEKIVDEESSSVSQIEINQDMNPFIFAYDKYINVLSKNVLNQYNKYGTQVGKINVNISVPVYDTNDKYLALADLNGQKIYMISGSSILWEQNLEGNISKVSINKNGYVSVVVTGTTYKTVIVVIDPEGKILFRYFLSNSYVPTISISNNNKYLAIGEIDYKGSIISSTVKILSIDLAQKEPDNAIINSYKSDNNAIILDIVYDDNYATCRFDKYVQRVDEKTNERILDITDDYLFLDIGLDKNLTFISKEQSGVFSFQYGLTIEDRKSKFQHLYIIDKDVPKSMVVRGDNIVLNFGDDIKVISKGGKLLKEFKSATEVKDMVLGDGILGIIYQNKIDIVNL
jgi:hypothetical protein